MKLIKLEKNEIKTVTILYMHGVGQKSLFTQLLQDINGIEL